jgi:hypothetical protein
MSVVGLRSYEYQRATDLAEKLGRLVERTEADPRGEGHTARQTRLQLALQLDAVAQLLDPLAPDVTIHAQDALRLPVPMLRELRDQEFDGRSLRLAMLDVVARLRVEEPLEERDVDLLRTVLAAASNEADDAFNRVVRR